MPMIPAADGRLRVGLLCECCLRIWVNGVRRPDTLAAYRWTGPNGNVTHLCASCCAWSRKHAKDDPSLVPQRIETIPPMPVSSICVPVVTPRWAIIGPEGDDTEGAG